MAARHTGRIEKELEIGVTSQHVLAVTDACAALLPHESKADLLTWKTD
jgi:hypothetical protein